MKKLALVLSLQAVFATADFAQTSLGNGAQALTSGSVAIGENAIAGFTPSGGLDDQIAVGNNAIATGVSAVAVGIDSNAAGAVSISLGDSAQSAASQSVAIGSRATVSAGAGNAVALGANSVANQANTVSVGSAGSERRITNVAAPVSANDAANKQYVDESIAAAGFDPTLTSRVSALESNVDKVEKRAAAGTSLALAMQNSGVSLTPGESAVGVGVGGYGGQGAIALTFSHSIKFDRSAKHATIEQSENGVADVAQEAQEPVKLESIEEGPIKDVVVSFGLGAGSTGGIGLRAGLSFKF